MRRRGRGLKRGTGGGAQGERGAYGCKHCGCNYCAGGWGSRGYEGGEAGVDAFKSEGDEEALGV